MFKFTDWYKTGNLKIGSPIVGGITKFLYKFTSNTATNPDGTRSLVNDGSSGVNADLYTGQGLACEGGQFINSGTSPNLAQKGTIINAQAYKSSRFNRSGCVASTNVRCYTGFTGSVAVFGCNKYFYLDIINATENKVYNLAMVFDGLGSATLYAGFNNFKDVPYTPSTETTSYYIGACKNTGDFVLGKIGLHCYIPEKLTQTQLQAVEENPEKLWYKDELGNVQSDILSPATITAMQSGTGFIYLLNKFTTDGTNWFTKNLCTDEDKVITGMSSDTLITNADQLPYGYQNALVNDDLTLKVIDWQATDNADLTAQALTEDNLDVVITGDPATNIKVYEV